MVNVASECGCTPQYQGLEKLYKEKKDAGLVVLGFPANNFGSQEPGSNEQISEFCTGKFGVTFPMFEKISVKGEDAHALYKKLAAQPKPIGGEPKWNFTKFVVNREGKVVARFDAQGKIARTGELEPELVKKIDELLGGSPKPEESKPGSSGGTTAGG
jgi:glutathione peroxidase